MATAKPRVTVTLELDQYDVLSRLAALEGRSIGSLVRELVEAVQPGLLRTVELGEAYRAASDGARATLAQAVGDADQAVTGDLANLESSALELMAKIEGILSEAATEAAPVDPPPLIRGVRSDPTSPDKGK